MSETPPPGTPPPSGPPGGPTHPQPTHPPKRGNGHALSDSGPRPGVARDGAGTGPTTLPKLVAAIRLEVARAFALTARQWDPATGPQQQDAPLGPDWVDIQLAEVRVDLRSALTALDGLRRDLDLDHPARQPGEGRTSGLTAAAAPVTASVEASRGVWPVGAAQSSGSRSGAPQVGAGAGLAQGVAPMGTSFSLPQPPKWSW